MVTDRFGTPWMVNVAHKYGVFSSQISLQRFRDKREQLLIK